MDCRTDGGGSVRRALPADHTAADTVDDAQEVVLHIANGVACVGSFGNAAVVSGNLADCRDDSGRARNSADIGGNVSL